MKYTKTLLSTVAVLLLFSSCGEPKRIETSTIQDVGTLPDGRVVKYIKRDAGNGFLHHIYYVENPNGGHSFTNTYAEGKTSQTVIQIDGVNYAPIEK